MKKKARIFIENDSEIDKELFTIIVRTNILMSDDPDQNVDNFFDFVITSAYKAGKQTFEAILRADEIYTSTALDLKSGDYIGSSAELFNKMMQLVILYNVENKSLFIQRQFSRIQWNNLQPELIDKAFRKNYIYTYADDDTSGYKWEQVDVDRLLRDKFNEYYSMLPINKLA